MDLAERTRRPTHGRARTLVRARALVGERYRAVRRLSGRQPSMGIVYEALDTVTGERVALKSASPKRNRGERELRLQLEGIALARIDHPNVVALRAHGQDPRRGPYLALELLEGEPWGARIRREGPQPFEAIARIGVGVCDALEAIHRTGVVHRDLKTEHVWLCADGSVRVFDLGLALLPSGEPWLRRGYVVGTPEIMSPEQWRDEPLDERSDLFSLGAVLFEALTGRSAFPGANPPEIADVVLHHDPFTRLLNLRPDVPLPWAMLVNRLLIKERRRRPARARDVREALEVLLETTEPAAWLRVGQLLGGPAGWDRE
ncbi:MAG: serine/threonine protein kinase [Sandaracinaceae bacterium]|nr:serine/threonine protein kinase [Sandaracinaceae bacterium]